MKEIKVLIVEDRDIIRDSIKLSLLRSKEIKITGEASDGEEAVDMLKKYSYDVVLMDINMPNLNGIEATKKILKINPEIKILGNSFFVNAEYVFKILNAGASGFITKGESANKYQEAILSVSKGSLYLSDEIDSVVYDKVFSYFRCTDQHSLENYF
jgi:DNA-binding NarL/FixJ family response regulator